MAAHLKITVRIMLTSRQPIWIGSGGTLTYLYHDFHKSIIGGKHPWALGRPAAEVGMARNLIGYCADAGNRDDWHRRHLCRDQLLVMERRATSLTHQLLAFARRQPLELQADRG